MTNPSPFEHLSVLYLEDEPLIAFDTADQLSDLGFGTVRAVHRLQTAIDTLADLAVDLAILDINVDRNQTSLGLGQSLNDRGVPVIFASGNTTDADRLRSEGYQFLDKPFTQEQLEHSIHAALKSGG